MKKIFSLTILGLCLSFLNAQTEVKFHFDILESNIGTDSYWDGSNGVDTVSFSQDNYYLEMIMGWDTSFGGYSTGPWAFSTKVDTTEETSDFTKHLYCARPGSGAESTPVYAIGFNGAHLLNKSPLLSTQRVKGFYIANTTYAVNSMLFGDQIGKKFNYDDKDSFVLKIYSYVSNELVDSTMVYLADFRTPGSSGILKSWQFVEFTEYFDSLNFQLYSSDNGQWGMNTPAFFALDGVVLENSNSKSKLIKSSVSLYPNPAKNFFKVNAETSVSELFAYDVKGQKFKLKANIGGVFAINHLPAGLYFTEASINGQKVFNKLIKE